MNMPLHPIWPEIAVRLVLTMIAAAIIGLDRSAKGQTAGLRTTILVGLAASIAMIQANILLSMGGKTDTSFSMMDPMRLPLGILTGVGFIGGGCILKRGDIVTGVTTAATLWATTVIGLCFGGGQFILGIVATVLAVITVWALKVLDLRIPRDHHAVLVIKADPDSSRIAELANLLGPLGYRTRFRRQSRIEDAQLVRLSFEISWRRPEVAGPPIDLVTLLNENFPVVSLELTPGDGH
jgi:putative Mg2+ transporter-C (MgtC) family protein